MKVDRGWWVSDVECLAGFGAAAGAHHYPQEGVLIGRLDLVVMLCSRGWPDKVGKVRWHVLCLRDRPGEVATGKCVDWKRSS